jgi:hypothetical protein
MSSSSRTARVAVASLAACAVSLAPAAGALAQRVDDGPLPPAQQQTFHSKPAPPPNFPTATTSSASVQTFHRKPAPPPNFPTATRSTATRQTTEPVVVTKTKSTGIDALGVIAISIGGLVLGFASALVAVRYSPCRVARA